MIQLRTKRLVRTKRALVLGSLVAALLIATLMLADGKPAHAATTFTVNIPGDTKDADLSDTLCDVNPFGAGKQCTLRAAIEQANSTPGADTIGFNIPEDFGGGVKTIRVGATGNGGLPLIKEQVTINGYTQPGASPNTSAKGTNAKIMIELDGSEAASSGVVILAPDSVIKGMAINRFPLTGIKISGPTMTGNKVLGNFVGTDPSGTEDLGNGEGGVSIENSSSHTIGGATPAERNLISGNTSGGVFGFGSSKNKVEGNLIGTEKDGITPLSNGQFGVLIQGGSDNSVGSGSSGGSNTIAFNGAGGVGILSGTGNRVLRNSIFSNAGLGIDLGGDGRTFNDSQDPDTGDNNLQNFPLLSSAKTVSGVITIKGRLNSTPKQSFKVQFFSNPEGTDEGKKFIGQKKVSTASDGKVSFTFSPAQKVGVGKTITATATGPGGNTSEFSAPKTVVAAS